MSPDISRDEARKVLEEVEHRTNIGKQETMRALRPGGLLHGRVSSSGEAKYGKKISPREQPEFWKDVGEQMGLKGSKLARLQRATRPSIIGRTLKELKPRGRDRLHEQAGEEKEEDEK